LQYLGKEGMDAIPILWILKMGSAGYTLYQKKECYRL
jgi:hypothetical protein